MFKIEIKASSPLHWISSSQVQLLQPETIIHVDSHGEQALFGKDKGKLSRGDQVGCCTITNKLRLQKWTVLDIYRHDWWLKSFIICLLYQGKLQLQSAYLSKQEMPQSTKIPENNMQEQGRAVINFTSGAAMLSPGLASSNLSCDFSLARRAASFNSLNWSANWRDKRHAQMCLHYPYIRTNQMIIQHLPAVVCAATPNLFIIIPVSNLNLIFACFIMDHEANLKTPITTKIYKICLFTNMHQGLSHINTLQLHQRVGESGEKVCCYE